MELPTKIGHGKDLALGGAGEAWFVVSKDVEKNIVFVTQGSDHPALYRRDLIADDISWVASEAPTLPLKCTAKVRYRQPDVKCTAELIGNQLHVTFDEPVKAITPKQSIVLYDGEQCLGGGIIT